MGIGSRRRRPWITLVGVLVVAFLVLSAIFFIWPSTDSPRRSQAIVVLGGSGQRLQEGVHLARAGFAPELVVSISPTGWRCPHRIRHVRIICFVPDPQSTQGEAEYVGRLAARNRWGTIIVVPGTPQVTRARVRVRRCFTGTILMTPVSPGGPLSWAWNVVYEWGAMAKALVWQRSC